MASAAPANTDFALCLSGGGFRAALFHLGVIRALRRCERNDARAIDAITEIYSVSGGSILAAHMMLNWDQYTGIDDDAFAEAEGEILTFVQRNIRDRVLRRAILTALPMFLWRKLRRRQVSGRTFWLRREYEHKALLGTKTIDDSLRPKGKAPTLHILTTSFRTGELCSFSAGNFEVERRDAEPLVTACNHLPLSFAVAASSAFPPMFPPLVLTDDLLANPFDDAFLNPILLSDGGVYDNLGIEKFRRNMDRSVAASRAYPGSLIVSDAGASFRASATKSYAGPFSRNIRASDILMHRVGDNAAKWLKGLTAVDDTLVSVSDIVDDGTLDITVQQRLRMVRTDLDRFGPELARLLIEHGERAACIALKAKGWTVRGSTIPVAPTSGEIARLNRLAGKAANRSFWWLPFDLRDLLPLAMLWAIAGLIGWTGYQLYAGYRDAKAEERDARAEEARVTAAIRTENKEHLDKLTEAKTALIHGNLERLRQILSVGVSDAQSKVDDDRAATSRTPAGTPSPLPGTALAKVTHTQRVYIQFAGTLTRDQIRALNKRLKDAGWNVQSTSGERIGSASGRNEVRFSAANAQAAQDLANAVSDTGITGRMTLPAPNASIGGNLELWISN